MAANPVKPSPAFAMHQATHSRCQDAGKGRRDRSYAVCLFGFDEF